MPKTGEKLWWITGLSWQPKSTPIVDGNIVYAHWWESGGEAEQPSETPDFNEVLTRFDTNHDRKITAEEFARILGFNAASLTTISPAMASSTSAIGISIVPAAPRETLCWPSKPEREAISPAPRAFCGACKSSFRTYHRRCCMTVCSI